MAEAESWQKEHISRAYLHAMATRAGYTIANWNVDKDGVDATIRHRGLMVDIQLKCTCVPVTTKSGYGYRLDKRTYDLLRDAARSAPGYLVLMIVPEDISEWIVLDARHLLLACHAYWARVQDRPALSGTQSTMIDLPSQNVLSVDSLRMMFVDAGKRLRGVA